MEVRRKESWLYNFTDLVCVEQMGRASSCTRIILSISMQDTVLLFSKFVDFVFSKNAKAKS